MLTHSIIIPSYNSSDFIEKTLDSITSQSYKGSELILLDDGSIDDSPKKIHLYLTSHKDAYLIQNINRGPGFTRNLGLDLAQGEYISFHDSDDLAHPYMVEKLLDSAKMNGADVAICGFDFCDEHYTTEDIITRLYQYKSTEVWEIYKNDIPKAFSDSTHFRGHVWGKVYHHHVLHDIRFNNLMSGEDTYFNIDVSRRAKIVVLLKAQYYFYKINRQSLTHTLKHGLRTIRACTCIALHCIDLYNMNLISKDALSCLLKSYGTNGILLHCTILLGEGCKENNTILKEVEEDIKVIKKKYPLPESIISKKYKFICMLLCLHQYWLIKLMSKMRNIRIIR